MLKTNGPGVPMSLQNLVTNVNQIPGSFSGPTVIHLQQLMRCVQFINQTHDLHDL